jgi:hypothetical protein
MSPSPDLMTEKYSVFETKCFLIFKIKDDGQCPETVILSDIHHCQNPSDSTGNHVMKRETTCSLETVVTFPCIITLYFLPKRRK